MRNRPSRLMARRLGFALVICTAYLSTSCSPSTDDLVGEWNAEIGSGDVTAEHLIDFYMSPSGLNGNFKTPVYVNGTLSRYDDRNISDISIDGDVVTFHTTFLQPDGSEDTLFYDLFLKGNSLEGTRSDNYSDTVLKFVATRSPESTVERSGEDDDGFSNEGDSPDHATSSQSVAGGENCSQYLGVWIGGARPTRQNGVDLPYNFAGNVSNPAPGFLQLDLYVRDMNTGQNVQSRYSFSGRCENGTFTIEGAPQVLQGSCVDFYIPSEAEGFTYCREGT